MRKVVNKEEKAHITIENDPQKLFNKPRKVKAKEQTKNQSKVPLEGTIKNNEETQITWVINKEK